MLLAAACFVAAWLGFALLALGQARHAAAVAGTPPRRRPLAAGAFLALALGLAVMRDGWGFGALLWATIVSLAAAAVVAALAWRPRWLRPLACAPARPPPACRGAHAPQPTGDAP